MTTYNQTKSRRVTVKMKTPNPLFEKWLVEWKNQAEENNSKMQFTFVNALKSLRKYPLILDSGQDCLILKGFGKKLCDMLDKKLKEHETNNESNVPFVERITSPKVLKKTNPKGEREKLYTNKLYKPMKGSGAWAILITLLKKSQEPQYTGSLTKNEIVNCGAYLCDKSFTKSDPGSFYTAWSSMSTLIRKKLVTRSGSPSKYNLTDDGEILALELINNDLPLERNQDNILIVPDEKKVEEINLPIMINEKESEAFTSSQTSSTTDTIIFAPKTFDIILLVDVQETESSSKNPVNDEALTVLKSLNVNFEVRHLKVGDFTWICRERNTQQELVLPYIVERKRIDDLGHSIKDGRFHEQKFRLRQCGIENLIYIVENYGSNSHTVLPLSSLMQGATNTLIQEKFQVKFTENHKHSMKYLSAFTLTLKNIYQNKTVISCFKENLTSIDIKNDLISLMLFKEFNKNASKQKKPKVKDVFIKQLLQLSGVSLDKALAIVEKYPTPKLLKMQYNRLTESQGDKLLANIPYGPLKKYIGPVINRTIFMLYSKDYY